MSHNQSLVFVGSTPIPVPHAKERAGRGFLSTWRLGLLVHAAMEGATSDKPTGLQSENNNNNNSTLRNNWLWLNKHVPKLHLGIPWFPSMCKTALFKDTFFSTQRITFYTLRDLLLTTLSTKPIKSSKRQTQEAPQPGGRTSFTFPVLRL